MKRGWILVRPRNIGLLRRVYDTAYIPQMKAGDQLPVWNRKHLADCMRYWRRVARFRGPGITEILAGLSATDRAGG